MKQLLFLDTETTGIDGGRLIELGYAIEDHEPNVFRFKNPVPIDIEAMATHHITKEHLKDLKLLKDMPRTLATIKDTVSKSILVAHNAKFDIGVLFRENISVYEFIDTKRVAKHLYPDAPRHNLQYLRYYLDLNVNVNSLAHSAGGDVEVLRALYKNLAEKSAEEYPDQTPISTMLELTRRPALVKTLQFGKHYDKTFEEIARTDPGYLDYLRRNPRDDEDITFTADYWLGKKI